jgi:hypothetical protein
MTSTLCTLAPVPYSDGWFRHEIPGSPFFINSSPKGTSFHVLEAGVCPRGMAWTHGKRGSLSAALKLVSTLKPSTPADIMARVKAVTPCDHDKFDRMAYLAEPGRRLWTLPAYGRDGYTGLGEAATATGLHASGVESLFGSPSSVWSVAFVTDSGREGSSAVPLTLEEARERWWILSHDGRNLVSGGHSSRANMERHALDYPGSQVVQGCMFIREDGSVTSAPASLVSQAAVQ